MNINMSKIWSETTDTFDRMDGWRIALVVLFCYFWGSITSILWAVLIGNVLGITIDSGWGLVTLSVCLGIVFCGLSFVFIPWPRNMIRCMGESGFKFKNWVFIRRIEINLEPYMADLHNYENRDLFYHEAAEWLKKNNKSRYVAYPKGKELCVFFTRKKEAVHFKMVWG